MRFPALAALLLVASAPAASAATGEVPLPEGATKPLALAFGPDGRLWATLDGTWALLALDPATGEGSTYPLAEPKAGDRDSLWGLRLGPDGAFWTASQTHLHRVDPETGNATTWALPTATELSGDVAFRDGKVLVAGVTSDAVTELDPATGEAREIPTPERFGPLFFERHGDALWVSGTYAGALARVGSDGLERATPDGAVEGPVGIWPDGDAVWVAEMGASSVARVEDGRVERWPTSPSPFYVISGPSEVIADDGKVWIVEHFADRLALLDPEAGTLVEWMAPSAPGTNMQRMAIGPDGRVWFAEWSKDQLGWVDPGDAPAPPAVPATIRVPAGGSVVVPFGGALASVGTLPGGPTVEPAEGGFRVSADGVAPGSHRVLFSAGERALLSGRYVDVEVTPAAESPAPALLALTLTLSLALVLWRRRP